MTFLGSKRKFIKDICPINKYIKENNITEFYDVFCGSGIVSENIECENIYASDLSPTLIALHQQAQKDFSKIPNEQTREQFNEMRDIYNKIIIKNLSDKNTMENYQKLVSVPLYEIGAYEWYCTFSARGFGGGYGAITGSRNLFNERRRNHFKQSQNLNYQKLIFLKAIILNLKFLQIQ